MIVAFNGNLALVRDNWKIIGFYNSIKTIQMRTVLHCKEGRGRVLFSFFGVNLFHQIKLNKRKENYSSLVIQIFYVHRAGLVLKGYKLR